jgi:hypothetical protein
MSRAAAHMEYWELHVLGRYFAEHRASWRNALLRRQAFSLAALSAALAYRDSGDRARALGRALQACWLWPLPLRRADAPFLARPRLLAWLVRRALAKALKPGPP